MGNYRTPITEKEKNRPSIGTTREILEGIFSQLKNGGNWCNIPKDFPPDSTVIWHYQQWREQGVLAQLMETLHHRLREQVKKNTHKWKTLIIIDSMAAKNTGNASIESKGFCFYKATNGMKRHLAVDSLGFPFFTHCTKASVSHDLG